MDNGKDHAPESRASAIDSAVAAMIAKVREPAPDLRKTPIDIREPDTRRRYVAIAFLVLALHASGFSAYYFFWRAPDLPTQPQTEVYISAPPRTLSPESATASTFPTTHPLPAPPPRKSPTQIPYNVYHSVRPATPIPPTQSPHFTPAADDPLVHKRAAYLFASRYFAEEYPKRTLNRVVLTWSIQLDTPAPVPGWPRFCTAGTVRLIYANSPRPDVRRFEVYTENKDGAVEGIDLSMKP